MNAPNPPAAPDDWITNPDLALPPSHPLRAGIIKRLPAPDICVVDRPLPVLPGEVRQVNDTYLEVASRAVKDRGGMAFLAVFGSIITLAGLSALVWASYQDDLADDAWLLVMMGVLLLLHTSIVYPPWTRLFFAPAYDPIRYMEAGTADIPPPAPQHRCATLGDYIEAFNPFRCRRDSIHLQGACSAMRREP